MRKPSYFVSQGLQGFLRNGVMSVASVAVLMACLVVLGCFALLVVDIDLNLENLGLMNEIVAFVDYDLTEEEIVAVEEKIRAIDYVDEDSVERITAAEGLESMKEKAGEYAYLYEEYEDDNPLTDSFKISNIDSEYVEDVVYSLQHIEGIRKVRNQLDLASTIESFKNGVMIVFVWFLAVLLIVSIFVIINTIKLSVYSRKEEIEVMRYIGATGMFISMPFVCEGVVIGIVASLPAFFFTTALYSYTVSSMADQLNMLVFVEVGDIGPALFLAFLGIGVLTGVVGSTISLSRYIRS
ncbi:MAG: ABC transporter permease [Clostridia bacterium]|nr:ABC transporter permease [Clostridia bacterium]